MWLLVTQNMHEKRERRQQEREHHRLRSHCCEHEQEVGGFVQPERPMNLFRKTIAGLQLLFLFAFCAYGQKTSKPKKLYEGAVRPPSELVTIVVQEPHPFHAMTILINGKWVGLHDVSQVLPGSYVVSILSLCGHPMNAPAGNPYVPFYSFYSYRNPFTAAAGDTVTYTIGAGDYPYLGYTPGTICYGAVGAYHTLENSLQEPLSADPASTLLMEYLNRKDAHAHIFPPLGPAATLVMSYLEAAGKGAINQSTKASFLSTDCEGDLSPDFAEKKGAGWNFSASNTKILSEKIGPLAGTAIVVAEMVFTEGPPQFRDETHVLTLVMENGAWKISKIAPWSSNFVHVY